MIETLHAIEIYKARIDIENLDTLTSPDFLNSLPKGKLQEYPLTPDMITGYASWYNIKGAEKVHEWEQFRSMMKIINQHAKIFWDHLGYWSDIFPSPYQSWINIGNKNGTFSSHVHYNVALSGVVYLDACPEQGNLVFEHPMTDLLGYCPIANPREKFKHEVQVNTGDLVLFPGYLRHYTLPNNTDRPRISFAMNFHGQRKENDA